MKYKISIKKGYLIFVFIMFSFISCKKLEFERIMDTSTDNIEINGTSVIVHGSVLDLGSSKIIHHGHCWSAETNPDINDFSSDLGIIEGSGDFFSKLNNLTPGVTFFVRSYIYDGNEYIYGDNVSFQITSDDIKFNSAATKKVNESTIIVNASTDGIGSVYFSQHGHCWSQTDPPTINDKKTTFGIYDSDNSFESIIGNLTFGRYFIRGYLESDGIIIYSNTIIYESQIAVRTDLISALPDKSFDVTGTITSLGMKQVTNHGHCWSTLTAMPDLNNLSQHSSLGQISELNNFTSHLSGLISGRIYYIRSYATDGDRVYYGETKDFIAN